MTGSWGFKVENRDHARFHYVMSGQCWLEAQGEGDPVRLDAGDLVILTAGQAHTLRDDLSSSVEPLADLLQRLPLDGKKNFVWENGGECTTMVCGGFRLEERTANPLLESLPPLLVIRDHASEGVSLPSVFALIDGELVAGAQGFDALVCRMSDVIFLQALRATLTADCARAPGLIRGLRDPAIGRALAAVHTRPGYAWTVEALAKEAAMSRSVFSVRFADLVGEAPMSYVNRWRLNRAAFWLRSGDSKVAAVATRVGYESEAALSRAFKRCFGQSPGAYRRHYAACNNDERTIRTPIERVPLYPSELHSGASGHQSALGVAVADE
jgi:AraC-like DNA-binding protein